VAPPDGSLVEIVDRAERLVVGRVVAAWVVRAPPEDAPGPPRATRDEVAILVLRAGDLERQLVRRRRALAPDVGAVGASITADERPEPAALADERALAAQGADLAGPLLGRRLVARQRSRFLVLGVQR